MEVRSASALLEAALGYARRGWRVIPLHTPTGDPDCPCTCKRRAGHQGGICTTPGKHPRLEGWPERATTDEEQIREWWTWWPEANVGIATGKESGFFALDIDGEAGLEALRKLEEANSPLPPTPEQITGGGGYHRLFRYAAGVGNKVGFAPHLDTRSDGGLIVAEPSLHESGREYAWNLEAHPDDVEIASAPGWLLTAIRKGMGAKRAAAGAEGDPIPEGQRNDTLFRDACAMRRRGFSATAIRAALVATNAERCKPALSLGELDKIAAQAASYDPEAPSLNGATPSEPAAASSGSGWDEPLDLAAVELPGFPVEVLPRWLRDYVAAVAAALSVPVGACGMFALACLAAACQRRVEAVVRPDWREPLSLWVLIVLPPANRKSQLFRLLLFPIEEYERELGVLMAPEIAAAKAEQRIVAGRLKKLEEQAVKGKSEFAQDAAEREAIKLAVRLEGLQVPPEPRLLVNDATPERLGMLLQNNHGRMAVMSPEGDVFEVMAGRYSNGQANLGLYLAGHSGDNWTVDRVNRDPVRLVKTALTFGLTVQPDVLAGFATKPQFRGRGLLGRFLYAKPESLLGERPPVGPPIPAEFTERYERRLRSLLALPALQREDGSMGAHDLPFDEEANAGIIAVQEWLEPRLGKWGDLHRLADWAGKLAGHTARVASLLHLAELAETPRPYAIPVGGESVAGARRLAEYLVPHAQSAFAAMGADPVRESARHILAWLKAHPCCRFSRRNLHRRLIGTFETVEAIDEPLAVLCEHGYIRQVVEDGPPRTGPKSLLFEVHPRWAGGGVELQG